MDRYFGADRVAPEADHAVGIREETRRVGLDHARGTVAEFDGEVSEVEKRRDMPGPRRLSGGEYVAIDSVPTLDDVGQGDGAPGGGAEGDEIAGMDDGRGIRKREHVAVAGRAFACDLGDHEVGGLRRRPPADHENSSEQRHGHDEVVFHDGNHSSQGRSKSQASRGGSDSELAVGLCWVLGMDWNALHRRGPGLGRIAPIRGGGLDP